MAAAGLATTAVALAPDGSSGARADDPSGAAAISTGTTVSTLAASAASAASVGISDDGTKWTTHKFEQFIHLRDQYDDKATQATLQKCIEFLKEHFPFVKREDSLTQAFTTKKGYSLLSDNILLIKPAPAAYDKLNPYTWHNNYIIHQSLEPMCDRQFALYCHMHGYRHSLFRLAPTQVVPTRDFPCGCAVCRPRKNAESSDDDDQDQDHDDDDESSDSDSDSNDKADASPARHRHTSRSCSPPPTRSTN